MTDLKKLRELAIDAMLDVEKDQDESDRFQFIKAANPQAIIEVLDMVDRYREALEGILQEVGTSTLAHKIAREALEGGK